jgi:hypothetical protein
MRRHLLAPRSNEARAFLSAALATWETNMSVIWEACAGKEWCVHIPFDGDKCLSARACIRVLEENAKFFLEIEINSRTYTSGQQLR